MLLLDDGLISMQVQSIDNGRVHCLVENGGVLKDRKASICRVVDCQFPDWPSTIFRILNWPPEMGADYVAVSFVSCADDIDRARELLRKAGSEAALIAKIERMEAIRQPGGNLRRCGCHHGGSR